MYKFRLCFNYTHDTQQKFKRNVKLNLLELWAYIHASLLLTYKKPSLYYNNFNI